MNDALTVAVAVCDCPKVVVISTTASLDIAQRIPSTRVALFVSLALMTFGATRRIGIAIP
jgi:hypothetical protein